MWYKNVIYKDKYEPCWCVFKLVVVYFVFQGIKMFSALYNLRSLPSGMISSHPTAAFWGVWQRVALSLTFLILLCASCRNVEPLLYLSFWSYLTTHSVSKWSHLCWICLENLSPEGFVTGLVSFYSVVESLAPKTQASVRSERPLTTTEADFAFPRWFACSPCACVRF